VSRFYHAVCVNLIPKNCLYKIQSYHLFVDKVSFIGFVAKHLAIRFGCVTLEVTLHARLEFNNIFWKQLVRYSVFNTLYTSSGSSRNDRFCKNFKKCHNEEGHVKASVIFPFVRWTSSVNLTTTYVRHSGCFTIGMRSGRTILQDSVLPLPAPTLLEWPFQECGAEEQTVDHVVQSIDQPRDCTAWQFWTMRRSNGCSTLASG